METEKKPEGKPEMDTAPMRISFKVPTLFFKKPTSGTEKLQSSQAEEKDEEMKITPPSMKDKLEESESEDDEQTEAFAAPTVPHHEPSSDEKLEATVEGDSDSKPMTDNEKSDSHRPKKSNRPMPASMRRKLVTNNLNLDTTKAPESDEDSNNDDEQTPPFEAHIVPHNGQPRSADEKLEATADADGDSDSDSKTIADNEKSDSHRSKKSNRPMPASMRRKLGKNNLGTSKAPESDEEDSNRADEQTEPFPKTMADNETSDSHRPIESHRPMPASMRRKLGKNNLDTTKAPESDDEVNDSMDVQSGDEPATGSISKDDEQSNDADEQENSDDSTRKSDRAGIMQSKKLNKSFKDSSNGHEHEQTENQDVPGKSSVSKRELHSLTTDKFCCQYCDFESYSLYTKIKHEEGHFKVKEDHSEITKNEPKTTTKKKTVKTAAKYKDCCPYCDRRIGNSRKLRKHVSSCATRKLEEGESEVDEQTEPFEAPPNNGQSSSDEKLEATVDGDSDLDSKTMADKDKSDSHRPKKKNRPMPASMRRKLGKNNLDTAKAPESDEGNESMDTQSRDEPATGSISKDLNNDADEEENSDDSTRKSDTGIMHSKKLNKSFEDSNNGDEQTENKEVPGKSSVSKRELQSLTTENYCCQYCDYEAYTLSAKNKHEKGHFKVKEDRSQITKKEPKPKTKEKIVKKEYKGFCPYCDKNMNNRKKLMSHVKACKRKCMTCNKQFKTMEDFRVHNEQLHSGNQDESPTLHTPQEHEHQDEPSMDQSPPPSPNNSSVGPKSFISTKSDDKSDTGHQSDASSNNRKTKKVGSYKRKIADVLGNLGSKLHKKIKIEIDEDITENDRKEPPPQKKIKQTESSKQKNESIKAMPSSVRKKLEDKEKDSQNTSLSEELSDLDDLECEVCHRVFTKLPNRQRHERNVHSLKNPRGPSASRGELQPEQTPKSKAKAPKKSATLTLKDLPKRGKCPICFKFISTNLRQHAKKVHKIKFSNSIAYTSSESEAEADKTVKKDPRSRSSSPESDEISKSAADNSKKKLASRPSSPMEELQASSRPSVEVATMETKVNKPEVTIPKAEAKKDENAATTELKCACCDEVFMVRTDFNEHMQNHLPKKKRLVTCKLCMHQFTHEEDFILHIQFKHKDISGMEKLEESVPKKSQKLPTATPHSSESRVHNSNQIASIARRLLRGDNATQQQEQDFNAAAAESCPKLTINISSAEKLAADDVLNQLKNNFKIPQSLKNNNKSNQRSSRRPRSPSPSPDPEAMDTFSEDGPASPVGLEDSSFEIEESGIANTETFSPRKTRSRTTAGPSTTNSSPYPSLKDDVNKMPCTSCKEVFYSFEALRKHELYFHNMKTSKMCPICGVYPTRLSRHLLAHENQTVKCSCDPCELNFADFASLLKHNLKSHPGPSDTALPTANKNITDETSKNLSENQAEEVFRCKLCKKEISGGSHARRHVRRAHPESGDYPENFLEKVEKQVDGGDENMDVGNTLEEANKTTLDSNQGDDYNPIPASSNASPKKPKRPLPASILAKLEAKKKKNVGEDSTSATPTGKPTVKRPLPASIRAKMEGKPSASTNPSNTTGSKPVKRPLPASIKAKLEKKKANGENSEIPDVKPVSFKPKLGRPMPASLRAKLATTPQKGSASIISDTISISSKISSSGDKPKPTRPMPASLRAKLASSSPKGPSSIISDTISISSKISASGDKPKSSRPMPGSMRANFTSNSPKGPASIISDTASNSSKASSSRDKPKRAMPASARLLNKAELKEVPPTSRNGNDAYSPPPSPEPNYYESRDQSFVRPKSNNPFESTKKGPTSSRNVVNLDDDDDDLAVGVVHDSVPVPVEGDSLGFNIADEITHHNKIMVHEPSGSTSSRSSSKNQSCTYKCKLCEKTFDSGDDIRGHIQQDHDEYGPEHTENLIETIDGETGPQISRRRRSNVNYNKSYRHDEDDEQEVILSRGTSTRPRGSSAQDPLYSQHVPSPSPAISHSIENVEANLLMYACKFCGKRMDMARKVKLHISKIHPGMRGLHEDEVVLLEAGREHEFVPLNMIKAEAPQEIIPPVVAPVAVSPIQVQTSSSPAKPKPKRPMPASARAKLLHKVKSEGKEPIAIAQDSVSAPVASDSLGFRIADEIANHNNQLPVEHQQSAVAGFQCKVCQTKMDTRSSLLEHISQSHPEVEASTGGDIQSFIQDVFENSMLNSSATDMESSEAVETYTCGFCSFQTTDENDYVLHYKTHTGVSPYRCQYCSATFDRQLQLTNHVTREHTGAEFLNDDEAEISMEEMVGVGEISVSTATRIQIDQPKVISLNRRFSNEDASPPEIDNMETPSEEQVEGEPNTAAVEETDPFADGDNGAENENDNELEEQTEETESFPMSYQGDLSSLFPTLGGSEPHGSLAVMDDGMDLD